MSKSPLFGGRFCHIFPPPLAGVTHIIVNPPRSTWLTCGLFAAALTFGPLAHAQVPVVAATPAHATGSDANTPIGTVERLNGSAVVVQKDSSPELSIGDVVRQDETLRTDEKSQLQLRLTDGSTITIGPQSELRLTGVSLLPNKHRLNLFSLLNGYLRAVITPLRPDSDFEVRTPSMVAAVRGTEWVERFSEGRTEIFVQRGVVAVSQPPPPQPAPDQPPNPPPPPPPQVRVDRGLGVDYGPDGELTPVAKWAPDRRARFIDLTTFR